MTVLIFIAILIVLILVHEFGHFFAAKLFGVKVEEFGIGFPPRLIGIKRGETLYSLNALPLGGFVRIFGEQGEGEDDPRSYAARPAWQRATILGAGVVGNLLLAFFLLWIGFTIGFPTALGPGVQTGEVIEQNVQIVGVATDSPADMAEIMTGDIIIRVKNEKLKVKNVTNVEEVQEFAKENKGQVLTLTIKQGGEVIEKQVLAREDPPEGEGAMGIVLAEVGLVAHPWYEALKLALVTTVRNAWLILSGIYLLLKTLLVSGEVIGEVSGPVGIAVLTGQFYALGIHYLLAFIALISINLAVLNVLPIPALDGGRLFFVIVEKLKGSPLLPETENKIHAAGFAFLIMLIVLITIRDVLQL